MKRRLLALAGAGVVVLGLAAGAVFLGPTVLRPMMMGNVAAPTGLDMASSRLTEAGLFWVSYTPEQDPIRINQIDSWILHIETADGAPVTTADIGVDGGMPQHGHGLPTRPAVAENLGGGDYRVEGIKFQMPGWWEVRFTITADGSSDVITFNLVLS